MSPTELVYTYSDPNISNDQGVTFVVMVDPEAYRKYKKGDTSIPLAQIVDSFTVLKYDHGRSGLKVSPSKRELQDAFGTSKEDDVIQIMLLKGKAHGNADMSDLKSDYVR